MPDIFLSYLKGVKEMKKKKSLFLSILLVGAFLLPTTTVLGSIKSFSGYLLPRWQGQNYTSTYQHNDPVAGINACVNKFTGTTKCYLWPADSGEDPLGSTTTTFTANGEYKWLYFSDGEDHQGEYVSLGMMNYYDSTSGAYVDGKVDFFQ